LFSGDLTGIGEGGVGDGEGELPEEVELVRAMREKAPTTLSRDVAGA